MLCEMIYYNVLDDHTYSSMHPTITTLYDTNCGTTGIPMKLSASPFDREIDFSSIIYITARTSRIDVSATRTLGLILKDTGVWVCQRT